MVAESKQNENSELLQDGNRYRYPLLPPSHPVPAPQIRCTILALYKLVCMYVCMYVRVIEWQWRYVSAYGLNLRLATVQHAPNKDSKHRAQCNRKWALRRRRRHIVTAKTRSLENLYRYLQTVRTQETGNWQITVYIASVDYVACAVRECVNKSSSV